MKLFPNKETKSIYKNSDTFLIYKMVKKKNGNLTVSSMIRFKSYPKGSLLANSVNSSFI